MRARTRARRTAGDSSESRPGRRRTDPYELQTQRHRVTARADATPVRPPPTITPLAAAGAEPVRRLAVANTQWANANAISASGDGASGVLFIGDGNADVVVKPGIHGAEELLAAHVHGMVQNVEGAAGGRRTKITRHVVEEWGVSALGVRLADANDVAGIAAAAGRVFGAANPAPAREAGLLGRVAAGTTMIQEKAGAPHSFGAQMAATAATADGHLEAGGARARATDNTKIRAASPLKKLVNEPGLAIAMGRMAATDILLGNYDRLTTTSNLDNFIVDLGGRTVYPIDNVVDEVKGRFTDWAAAAGGAFGNAGGAGAQPVVQAADVATWAAWTMVQELSNGHYDAIATAVFSGAADAAAINAGLMATLMDELVVGHSAGGADFVAPAEQAAVRAKLERKRVDLIANFALGLQQAHQAIIQTNGGLLPAAVVASLPANDGVTVRVMYATRTAVLTGMPLAAAQQQAQMHH